MKKKLLFLCICGILALSMTLSACSENTPSIIKRKTKTVNPTEYIDDFEIADILDLKHTLRTDENGKFRVLVISDVQCTGEKLPDFIKENIKILVDREAPQLVLFLGDNSFNISNEETLYSYLTDMTSYVEEKQIPWAHVYGNHDDENEGLDKAIQQRIYESFEWCVSRSVEADVYGVGNYVLPVLDNEGDEVVFNLFAFDSGSYLSSELVDEIMPEKSIYSGYSKGIYDYIRNTQVEWYEQTSQKMEDYYGKKIPAIAYFHIPLQENYLAWVNRGSLEYEGEKREYITASPINSGLFNTMVERGDVKAVITGHDHTNDYAIDYRGIKLCSSATVGNHFYYDDDMIGGRVIVFDKNNEKNITTYMSYIGEHNGRINTPLTALNSDVAADFEKDTDYFVSAYYGSREDYERYYELKHGIFEGKGVGGSAAFGVTREAYNENYSQNTIECNITLNTSGSIGNNKYVKVWLDLSGENTAIDFGKATVGVVVDKQRGAPHVTGSLALNSEFYYLADGSGTWKTYSMNDGAFGKDEGVSVEGMKGYFVFSLDDMFQTYTQTPVGENDRITGFYILFTLADESMVGEYVYIDNISFVETFDGLR